MPPGMSPEMQQRMRFQGQMPPNPMMGPGGPNQQGPHPNQINGPNSNSNVKSSIPSPAPGGNPQQHPPPGAGGPGGWGGPGSQGNPGQPNNGGTGLGQQGGPRSVGSPMHPNSPHPNSPHPQQQQPMQGQQMQQGQAARSPRTPGGEKHNHLYQQNSAKMQDIL